MTTLIAILLFLLMAFVVIKLGGGNDPDTPPREPGAPHHQHPAERSHSGKEQEKMKGPDYERLRGLVSSPIWRVELALQRARNQRWCRCLNSI